MSAAHDICPSLVLVLVAAIGTVHLQIKGALLDARHIRHHLRKLDQRSVTMTCGWKRGVNNGKAVEQECESSMVVQGCGLQGFNGGARVWFARVQWWCRG